MTLAEGFYAAIECRKRIIEEQKVYEVPEAVRNEVINWFNEGQIVTVARISQEFGLQQAIATNVVGNLLKRQNCKIKSRFVKGKKGKEYFLESDKRG